MKDGALLAVMIKKDRKRGGAGGGRAGRRVGGGAGRGKGRWERKEIGTEKGEGARDGQWGGGERDKGEERGAGDSEGGREERGERGSPHARDWHKRARERGKQLERREGKGGGRWRGTEGERAAAVTGACPDCHSTALEGNSKQTGKPRARERKPKTKAKLLWPEQKRVNKTFFLFVRIKTRKQELLADKLSTINPCHYAPPLPLPPLWSILYL